jgi:hypothetical protein
MICDECRARGLPRSVWYFYSHFWGTGHDHVCPPLTEEEIRELIKEEMAKQKDENQLCQKQESAQEGTKADR